MQASSACAFAWISANNATRTVMHLRGFARRSAIGDGAAAASAVVPFHYSAQPRTQLDLRQVAETRPTCRTTRVSGMMPAAMPRRPTRRFAWIALLIAALALPGPLLTGIA